MNFGVCPLSVVPVRSAPSDKSEMVSQLLFGELFEVLEKKDRSWLRIRCEDDNCVGWAAVHQVRPVTPTEFAEYRDHFAFNLELVQPAHGEDHFLPLTMGARLPLFDGLRFRLGEQVYSFTGRAVTPEQIKPDADLVLKIARRYLQAPFLWGGRSPFGIDGAGLVQVVFRLAGIRLPREPHEQILAGAPIDFIEQTRPADLAFFENRLGRIAHVGIILPGGAVIHAHDRVRIDRIDHFGIYDEQRKRYSHRLRLVKRILPPPPLRPDLPAPAPQAAGRQAELF